MTTATMTMMTKIDGDRIDRTDETHVTRKRTRRNDARRDVNVNANVTRSESVSGTLDQNDIETTKRTSLADSSTTLMKTIAVASRIGRTVTGSGSGSGSGKGCPSV